MSGTDNVCHFCGQPARIVRQRVTVSVGTHPDVDIEDEWSMCDTCPDTEDPTEKHQWYTLAQAVTRHRKVTTAYGYNPFLPLRRAATDSPPTTEAP